MTDDTKALVDTHGNPIESYEQTDVIQISEGQLKNYEFIAANMERFIAAKEKIWQAVLKIVKTWTVFGDTADIGWAESDRIASIFGVSYVNWSSHKAESADDKGEKYIWSYECDALFQGRSVHVQGNFSSRDKLLGKQGGVFRPLYEINEQHIQTAAMRNCRKEGVKVLFGISRIPVIELEKVGVNLEYADKVDIDKKKEQTPEQKKENIDKRKAVAEMLKQMSNNVPEDYANLLETYSSFIGKDNKTVKGKRKIEDLSDGSIYHTYLKVKADFDKTGKSTASE